MRDAVGGVQSVLVLGGASELGLALVRRLVADRCRTVVLAARRPERLDPVVGELRAAGATDVEAVAFDATDVASHQAVIDGAAERHGDLDLVVVAVGVLGDPERLRHDPVATAELLSTNLAGAAAACTAAAERLRQQGHGTLLVFSSVAGVRVRAANHVYGASKAGLDGFAQGLGDALVGTGVQVVVVRPGFVHGRMTAGMEPAPFATTPEAVAEAVVAGLARGQEVIWAPPVLRLVFAVMRVLPRAVWRRVSAR